jgi:prepilin-type N-terminal cleavage/methylation domain-containing protein
MGVVNRRGDASRSRTAGFTLVELMVVAAIIGILAAVSLPAYQDYTIRSKVLEGLALMEPAKLAVKEYYDRWGVLPANNARAGLPQASDIRGRYVQSVSVANGVVTVEFNRDLMPSFGKSAQPPANAIYLRPGINREAPTGPLAWRCGSGGDTKASKGSPFDFPVVSQDRVIEPKYRPGSCRD